MVRMLLRTGGCRGRDEAARLLGAGALELKKEERKMQGKAKRLDERRHQKPLRKSHSRKSRGKRARVSLAARAIDDLLDNGTRKDVQRLLALPGGAQAVLKWFARKLQRFEQRQIRIRNALRRIKLDIA